MSPLPERVARELGRRLHAAGFRPLPADDGALIGTRLWRVRAGYVEYLALRAGGLAHVIRAEATFDYQRSTEHGPAIEHHSSHALNALNRLLTSADQSSGDLSRPYASGEPDEQGGARRTRPCLPWTG